MFAIDLKKEAVKLPRDLIEVMQRLVEHFAPTLESAIPVIFENLKEHINTIFVESAVGMLDKKKLEKTIAEVMKEVLRDAPASRSAG